MLVPKSNKLIGKISCLKLISSEEIIGRIIDEDDNYIQLTRPLIFIMGQNIHNPSQAEVSFAPWMVGAPRDNSVKLNNNTIICKCEAGFDVIKAYKEATGDISNNIKNEPVNKIVARGRH